MLFSLSVREYCSHFRFLTLDCWFLLLLVILNLFPCIAFNAAIIKVYKPTTILLTLSKCGAHFKFKIIGFQPQSPFPAVHWLVWLWGSDSFKWMFSRLIPQSEKVTSWVSDWLLHFKFLSVNVFIILPTENKSRAGMWLICGLKLLLISLRSLALDDFGGGNKLFHSLQTEEPHCALNRNRTPMNPIKGNRWKLSECKVTDQRISSKNV